MKNLQIKNLTVQYGNRTALSVASLEIVAGSHISIIGTNGAGKTSLLRALLGLVEYRGELALGDTPLASLSVRERAKIFAYVPQTFIPQGGFTVRELVLLSRFPYGTPLGSYSAEDRAHAEKSIEICELSSLQERFLSELSGGELQRVLLASAICQDTPFLLLDEFSSSLDPSSEERMYRVLERLRTEHGRTILSSCHDINRAAFSATHILALKDGAVAFTGSPETLMDEASLTRVFGKTFQLVPHPQRTSLKMALPGGTYE